MFRKLTATFTLTSPSYHLHQHPPIELSCPQHRPVKGPTKATQAQESLPPCPNLPKGKWEKREMSRKMPSSVGHGRTLSWYVPARNSVILGVRELTIHQGVLYLVSRTSTCIARDSQTCPSAQLPHRPLVDQTPTADNLQRGPSLAGNRGGHVLLHLPAPGGSARIRIWSIGYVPALFAVTFKTTGRSSLLNPSVHRSGPARAW